MRYSSRQILSCGLLLSGLVFSGVPFAQPQTQLRSMPVELELACAREGDNAAAEYKQTFKFNEGPEGEKQRLAATAQIGCMQQKVIQACLAVLSDRLRACKDDQTCRSQVRLTRGEIPRPPTPIQGC